MGAGRSKELMVLGATTLAWEGQSQGLFCMRELLIVYFHIFLKHKDMHKGMQPKRSRDFCPMGEGRVSGIDGAE